MVETKTIDITPTWVGLLPALIAVLENGTPEGRKVAIEQLNRMAVAADNYVALCKDLEKGNGHET